MKKLIMTLFSALLVLFTVLPSIQPEAAEVTIQAKQEFELPFEILKAENDEKSTAGDFVKSPAKVVVEDGKTYVYVTLLQSKFWQSLKVQTTQPGTFKENNFVDAVEVSQDEKEDTKVVKFEVRDVTKILNVKAHIIVTGVPGIGKYDHSYDLRLKLDSSKIPTTPVSEVVKDGAYTIDFKTLHAEKDEASTMARYIETPAALSVKDGKNFVALTLNDNEQITAFQAEQNGKLVDATVIKVDEKTNKRVVEFEVADLSAIINAKVSVYVASANHTGNYTIRLSFDKASIKAIKGEETPAVKVLFTDIKNSFAKTYIESLTSKQIIKGLSATTFAPDAQITRAQFTVILSRALELPKQEYKGTFSDVTTNMEWAVSEIEAASRAGIANGSGGKFIPNEPITREQMAAMIIRSIEYKDASVLTGVKNDVLFTDAKNISAYAKTSVDLAAGLGIISGKEINGKKVFEPKEKATRAHSAKMVYYLLEKLEK
ncbi:NEAT domain-containing protein [Sporosarcina sp. BP05]|uniref:NEAT domain-containing protein n=1 Tax=Sporosarcina sp. BP05 TaxID=2758726 RepID=UPI00164844B9|nr:NEAT domain-containing protein [Sporosarcina sp. BP05]